jgi:hypothetical protein
MRIRTALNAFVLDLSLVEMCLLRASCCAFLFHNGPSVMVDGMVQAFGEAIAAYERDRQAVADMPPSMLP